MGPLAENASVDEVPAWQRRTAFAIRLVTHVIQVVLLGRVVLLLFPPTAASDFGIAYLTQTQMLIDPFRWMVQGVFIDPWSGTIVDMLALAALLGYTLVGYALLRLLFWERHRPEPLPWLPPVTGVAVARATARTRLIAMAPAVPLSKVIGSIRRGPNG